MGCKIIVGIVAEVAVVVAALIQMTSATTYVVGDGIGWDTPSYGSTPYATWAVQHTFHLGDNIVFNFQTGVHTAAQVDEDYYNSCDPGNTINLQNDGPATFTLTSVGTMYFICTIHCSEGQKVSINVLPPGTYTPPGYYYTPPGYYIAPPYYYSNAPKKYGSFLIVFVSIVVTCFLY